MSGIGIIRLLILVANFIVSYKGFKDKFFYSKYEFEVEKVLLYKDYKRLVTSGFLHVNWMHLIFNMFSLYFFSGNIESYLGAAKYLLIYFASLVGGNLFALFAYRNQNAYSSVGASGAVCGIMFASIALFPGMQIGFFFIPVGIPGWIYGLLFVLFSIYGIRSRKDNVGHEAHLAGALTGMLIAIILEPSSLMYNYFAILIIAVPTVGFIYIIIKKPHLLLVNNLFYNNHHDEYSIDHIYNKEKTDKQKEVDRILDKINQSGMRSLTKKEKQLLDEYSKAVK